VQVHGVVGAVLVAGLVVFFVGAAGWRMAYEQPLPEALRVIHRDRRRRAWIHLWMIPALFVTPAGIVGYAVLVAAPPGAALAAMGAAVYVMGAVCWVAALAFRLTVVPWAAQRTVADAAPPAGFEALDDWAGALYVVHMASAYAAFAVVGAAVLVTGELPAWLGWLGVGWGVAFLAGFVATRFSGPFNPPFWAHTYTAVLGVLLIRS
jgi:hypothetical protein